MTDSDNDTQYQARSVENVGYWHNPDLQRPLELGPLIGALPTFGAECRVSRIWAKVPLESQFKGTLRNEHQTPAAAAARIGAAGGISQSSEFAARGGC